MNGRPVSGIVAVGASLIALLGLTGCPATPPVPLDRPSATPTQAAGTHRVQSGDTLYSIAFRNHLDWRDIARWNQLGPPYTIYPGQQLTLRAGSEDRAQDAAPSTATTGVGRPGVLTRPDIGAVRDLPPIDLQPSTDEAVQPPPTEAVVEDTPLVPAAETEAVSETPQQPLPDSRVPPAAQPGIAAAPERSVAGVAWRWPTDGRLVRRFDPAASRKGIGIAGDEGQAVVAAAAGQVVYSGTGLLGYGELIIIKHSDNLLSAYGHNRRRLVNEGDTVRAGETIAEMGRNERNEQMLHFEIRNNGQPTDPLGYLPTQ